MGFGESSEVGSASGPGETVHTRGVWVPSVLGAWVQALTQGLLLTSGMPSCALGHPDSVPHILITPFRLSGSCYVIWFLDQVAEMPPFLLSDVQTLPTFLTKMIILTFPWAGSVLNRVAFVLRRTVLGPAEGPSALSSVHSTPQGVEVHGGVFAGGRGPPHPTPDLRREVHGRQSFRG